MGQEVFDGNSSFLGGQNAGLDPNLIAPTQYAKGINLSTKKGSLGPRPGFRELDEMQVITEGGIQASNGKIATFANIFRKGKFQGAGPYINDQGKFMIATISGIIFAIDPIKMQASVLEVAADPSPLSGYEPTTQRLNQYVARHNWAELGQYYGICDAPDYPVILQGLEARRADPTKYEIPLPANILAYNQNRAFAFSIYHEFTGGDPVGNLATPGAPITFEEVFAPAAAFGGQVFSLGSTNINNPITAVGYLEQVDGSTEIGPMFVATNKSIYQYQTQLPRTAWEANTFGSKISSKTGIAGQRAFTNVGPDVWFMGGDRRIRSMSVVRGDQGKWVRTPLDKEVLNWMRFCDPELVKYTVAAFHNNRIFFTVNPEIVTARDLEARKVDDVCFRGLVSLDLDNVSGFMQNGAPSWDGLWTGLRPMEMVELDQDLYIFSKSPNGDNEIYLMEPDEVSWDTSKGKKKQIVCRVDLRAYEFMQQGVQYALKEEVTLYPGIKNVTGNFCMEVSRRNDDFPNYTEWRKFQHTATPGPCKVGSICGKDSCYESEDCQKLPILAPHSFREINFGSPQSSDDTDFCNPVTNEQMQYFNKTQFQITFTGLTWEMTAFRVKAELKADDNLITQVCDVKENVEVEKLCEQDFDLYSTAFKEGGWSCQLAEC